MDIINENPLRIGNFTSSGIWPLTTLARDKKSPGAPYFAYIEEKRMERRHGLSISTDMDTRDTSWGKHVEKVAFDQMTTAYVLKSLITIPHPTIPSWVGSPDAIGIVKETLTVVDIKCPRSRKSFSELVDPLYDGLTGMKAMDKIRDTHAQGDKFYWQLISNAILTGATHAELIVYMPYKSELEGIKALADNSNGEDMKRYSWIFWADEGELPHLKDNGFYKNLNIIRFEVPQSDKDFLTERVLLAEKELLKETDVFKF